MRALLEAEPAALDDEVLWIVATDDKGDCLVAVT